MRLEGDDWRTFFDVHEREAFRLETRQSYGVESERAEFEHFLSTGQLDIPDTDQWLTPDAALRSDWSMGRARPRSQ